jgi:hypothetical protein
MKHVVPLTLAFILTVMLGAIAELCGYHLVFHAQSISEGKPLPPLSEWLYDNFGRWHNGAILSLFLIPWAAWLVLTILVRPRSGVQSTECTFWYAFALWALVEAILFTFVLFCSAWPLLPYYITPLEETHPLRAYLPQLILATIGLLAIGAAITRLRK